MSNSKQVKIQRLANKVHEIRTTLSLPKKEKEKQKNELFKLLTY